MSDRAAEACAMEKSARRPRIYPLLLVLLGLVLLAGGVELAALGGSWWYMLSGAAIVVAAALLWKGSRWGAWLYGALLACTVAWSVWEAGLDLWALAPRLVLLAAVGLWLLTPFLQRGLDSGPPPLLGRSRRAHTAAAALVATLGLAAAGSLVLTHRSSARAEAGDGATVGQAAAGTSSDWPNYGGDIGGSRYSSLAQITPANVGKLRLAWSFRTGDLAAPGEHYNYEATPLKIGALLYVCTPRGQVFALDPATGKPEWRFDPGRDTHGVPHLVCRGVSYYDIGRPGPCAKRIYVATPSSRLWSVDALTGQACREFGEGGAVDLLAGLGRVPRGLYAVTSPPVLVRGRLVLGAQVLDNVSTDMPSGVVRAFDAVTGRLEWAWDMGHPDRHGAPPAGETYTRSTPNAWAPLAADDALGLVYVPTGNPSPDFWGRNRRPFDERYGSSLVALDVGTGAVRWSFQTVHHDLWDLDLPAQPVLADIPTASGLRPAVIQGTKPGYIYILDRRTGAPIIPVTERPAPQGSNIEDQLSPTQPASALQVEPIPSPLTEGDMWGLTPIDQLWCRIAFRKLRYQGPFTPPDRVRETLDYPGMGIEWGGLSLDPRRQVLISNPSSIPLVIRMTPLSALSGTGSAAPSLPKAGVKAGDLQFVPGTALQIIQGTGYAMSFLPFTSPLQIPCVRPPWGRLYAIDLRSDRILWERRVGTARDSGPFGIPTHLPLLIGTPQMGGTITTRGGLIFSGATADDYIRAYATRSGRELWRARLPAGGQATPMSFESGGRQFVVITAGGHGLLGTKSGDYVLAYALLGAAWPRLHGTPK